MTPQKPTFATAVVAILTMLLVLTGCSATSGGAPSADSSGAGAGDAAQEGAAGSDGSAPGAAADDAGLGAVTTTGTADEGGAMMVRRVELELLVEDVSAAVTRARATTTGAGGWVESEDVAPATEDRAGYGSLVLRVPSEGLDSVVERLGELGEVTASRSNAENVGADYRDMEARIATMEAGTDRLRELVGQAGSIEDIASLERELSSREADLDGLKARLAALADDVARSTITLHLAEQQSDLDRSSPDTGFLVGLKAGWDAFVSSVTVLITALGAVLPFAVVAAVFLLALLWWRRRRRTADQERRNTPATSER